MALGGRPMADWIAEYAQSHRHPVNRACHTVGIPTVTLAFERLMGFVLAAMAIEMLLAGIQKFVLTLKAAGV